MRCSLQSHGYGGVVSGANPCVLVWCRWRLCGVGNDCVVVVILLLLAVVVLRLDLCVVVWCRRQSCDGGLFCCCCGGVVMWAILWTRLFDVQVVIVWWCGTYVSCVMVVIFYVGGDGCDGVVVGTNMWVVVWYRRRLCSDGPFCYYCWWWLWCCCGRDEVG